MVRYHHEIYAGATTPRYVVLFDLQWKIIECERLEPCADLRAAMTAATQRLTAQGWQAEGLPVFGFVFLSRDGDRRLLILSERDPYDQRLQSFSPFK